MKLVLINILTPSAGLSSEVFWWGGAWWNYSKFSKLGGLDIFITFLATCFSKRGSRYTYIILGEGKIIFSGK